MDKHVLWISLISIYLLLLINGIVFLVTIDMKIKEARWQKSYQKMYDALEADVIAYLNRREAPSKDLFYNGNELKTNVMMELLKVNGQSSLITKSQAFETLGYVDGVINESKKKLALKQIKQLGVMASPRAFPILMKGTSNEDFETVYQSCYALSLLPMEEQEAKAYVAMLLGTNILRDRMIEMIINLSLSIEVYWRLLLLQNTELGKVVLIRALEDQLSEADPTMLETVIDYVVDPLSSKETRIAAVVALAATKDEKYLHVLLEQYGREEAWEVRAAVAKALNKYTEKTSIDKIRVLREMMYDSNWWVRFNAAEVLARKGLAGIDALVDISLNSDDQEASNLAFYMLDANPSVNESLQMVGVENNV